jgi:hypothetical protein
MLSKRDEGRLRMSPTLKKGLPLGVRLTLVN